MTVTRHIEESEDEFFEDFSGWEITNQQLAELLVEARTHGDVRLRRVVKQNQYFRWILEHLVSRSEQGEDVNWIVELASEALKKSKS
jgi:hypothetical protein